jgi:transglutaminase/protease-like cytokinesis protein 3
MATTKKPIRRKKTTTKKTTTLDKTEAQKKVDELLEGIELTKKDKEVVSDRLETATKEKQSEWMENQMTALTSKIELLEEVHQPSFVLLSYLML